MGNLPSTVSCASTSPALNPIGVYNIAGRLFLPACNFDTSGANLAGQPTTTTFYNCITGCAALSGCLASSWTPGSGGTGSCYMKSAIGTLSAAPVPDVGASSFTFLDPTAGAAACPANQICNPSTYDTTPACDASNGHGYTSTNNVNWAIECNKDYNFGDNNPASTNQVSFKACIDYTATTNPGSVAAVYAGGVCYPKNAVNAGTTANGVSAAVKVGTTRSP